MSQTLHLCTHPTIAGDFHLQDADIDELNYFDWTKVVKLDLCNKRII